MFKNIIIKKLMSIPISIYSLLVISTASFNINNVAIVIPIWGQSNATGYGTNRTIIPIYLNQPISGTYVWNKTKFDTLKAGVNLHLYDSTAGVTTNNFGLILNCAYLLKQYTNREIYFIEVTSGGTSMYQKTGTIANDWNVNSSNELYYRLYNEVNKATNKLDSLGIKYTMNHILSIQGESDGNTIVNSNSYYQNRVNFIDSIRVKINKPYLIDVFGKMSVKQINNIYSLPYINNVRAKQDSLSLRINTYMIGLDTCSVNSDSTHFTTNSQLSIGRLFFDRIKNDY